ncbi:membrane PM19L [Olea europaea subsp. europaea]|uniref:Membrane PM19L n=1 Tax=Olea europaea subsp. europaea TaxID=158383 RepID=A0A8S0V2H1_OLEEU|nr:membrane PM19L [Olea europaea subsp. europaea]
MANRQLKPVTGLLLVLNFCMYAIVLGIGAHFLPIYFPMGIAATGFFVTFAMIAGVVGIASIISGFNNFRYWSTSSLPAAISATTIAWTLTLLAIG